VQSSLHLCVGLDGTSSSAEAKSLRGRAPNIANRHTKHDGSRQTGEMDTPVNLQAALSTFDQIWSPRIIGQVNDYDVRIAKVAGEHVWHVHDNTDEFFLVIDGQFNIALRDSDDVESTVTLNVGEMFTVPRGTYHRPFAPDGASILMFEPTGTSSTGDDHEAVPDHVHVTTGQPF
jgi:mannose-6-phosphate isomerase-like protein (cupin superfamily)